MQDPQHKGIGFYDVNDVESIIRAIRNDAGMRLFNAIQVMDVSRRQGIHKLKEICITEL